MADRLSLADGDPRHGTRNGYSNLKCRCTACRAAFAAYTRQRQQERVAERELVVDADGRVRLVHPRAPHGTAGGYGNYRCQCVQCLAAWSVDTYRRTRRNRERRAT